MVLPQLTRYTNRHTTTRLALRVGHDNMMCCKDQPLTVIVNLGPDWCFLIIKLFIISRVSGRGYKNGAVCVSVCLSVS